MHLLKNHFFIFGIVAFTSVAPFLEASASGRRQIVDRDGNIRTETLCGPLSQEGIDVLDAANKLSEKNDYSGALQVLDAGLAHIPDSYSQGAVIAERAFIYRHLAEYRKAIADFSFQLDEKNYAARFWIGDCYYRLKQYDQALLICNESLALKPDFANAEGLRGRILFQLGENKKALADLSDFLEKKPKELIPSEYVESNRIKSEIEKWIR